MTTNHAPSEARLLTLDEVCAMMKVPVWRQTKNRSQYIYQGWVLTYEIQKGMGITGTRLGMAEPSGRVVWYKIEDYNKTWRCWDKEPADEQRKVTPWE